MFQIQRIRKDTDNFTLTESIITYEGVKTSNIDTRRTSTASSTSKDVFDDSLDAQMLNMDTDSLDSGVSSSAAIQSSKSSDSSVSKKRTSLKRKWSPTRQATLSEFFRPNSAKSKENGISTEESDSVVESNSSDQPMKEDNEIAVIELGSSGEEVITVPSSTNGDADKTEDDADATDTSNPRKRSREDIEATTSDSKEDSIEVIEEPKPKSAKTCDDKSAKFEGSDSLNSKVYTKDKNSKTKSSTASISSNSKKPTKQVLIDDLFGGSSPQEAVALSKETKEKPKIEKRQSSSSSSHGSKSTSSNDKSRSKSSSTDNGSEHKLIGKQEMADIVITYLMPYFKNKKIDSKEKFKQLARDYSHQAIKRGFKSKL